MKARLVDGDGEPMTDWVRCEGQAQRAPRGGRWLLPLAVLFEHVSANTPGLRECEIELTVET